MRDINSDKEKVEQILVKYINIICEEYGKYIGADTIIYLKENIKHLVEFNSSSAISFIVKGGKLLLPKNAYIVFDVLKQNPNYGINSNDKRNVSEYLDTDTTYYDYINHAIVAGLDVIDYFLESLLHEAMHLCGSGGGEPLSEGLNELKTRELAQKYNLKISGYGYPKEVEVSETLQEIIGKDVMDRLTFIDSSERYQFLSNIVGADVANLYSQVSCQMLECCKKYNVLINEISDPFEKAMLYDSIDYSSAFSLIDSYKTKNK